MMLTDDLTATTAALVAGELACHRVGCGGRLGPWGYARPRVLRLGAGRSEAHTPRRARCRSCGGTEVVISARSYPRRVDTVETVGRALLAAVGGLGHRAVARQVRLPATTVRDWLRRARVNAEAVRVDATVAVYRLDPMAAPLNPTGSALGDMVDAVGRAVAASILRLGPSSASRWQLALMLTRAGILAKTPRPRWHGLT